MNVVKVLIKKSAKETYWYNDMVGQIFECLDYGVGNFDFQIIRNDFNDRKCYFTDGLTYCIKVQDVIILDDTFVVYNKIKKLNFNVK